MPTIKSYKFNSHSPTVQYGFVETELEVSVDGGENYTDARDYALSELSTIDAMVSPTPFTLKKALKTVTAAVTRTEQITSRLTGITLNYDPEAHVYTSLDGVKYLSGSSFPDQFYAPFDKTQAIEMVQKAYPDSGVTPQQLLDIWSTNGDISTNFGNSVHAAMENYIKYNKLGDLISKAEAPNKALSKNPFFSKLVKDYVEKFGVDGLLSEEFVADGAGHCGRIDYIKIVDKDKKIIRIGDFKTDTDLFEKKYQKKDSPFKGIIKENTLLTYHRFQMSYYAYILSQFGYTVEGIDLDWLNPNTLEWERHSTEVIDLTEVLKGDK